MPVSMHSACMVWCQAKLNSFECIAHSDLSRTCIAQCKNICLQDAGLQLFAPFCLCFCSCVFLTLCMHLYKCMYGPGNALQCIAHVYIMHAKYQQTRHTHKQTRHTHKQTRHTHKQTRRQVRHVTMCMYANNHANTQAQHANAYGQPF